MWFIASERHNVLERQTEIYHGILHLTTDSLSSETLIHDLHFPFSDLINKTARQTEI